MRPSVPQRCEGIYHFENIAFEIDFLRCQGETHCHVTSPAKKRLCFVQVPISKKKTSTLKALDIGLPHSAAHALYSRTGQLAPHGACDAMLKNGPAATPGSDNLRDVMRWQVGRGPFHSEQLILTQPLQAKPLCPGKPLDRKRAKSLDREAQGRPHAHQAVRECHLEHWQSAPPQKRICK